MKSKISLISTSILLFCFTSSSAGDPPRPLVFIPGILGTTLVDTAGRIVWGDALSLTRLPALTIKDGPKDPNDNLIPSAPIQQIAILGPWKVKQYTSLRETLKGLGYELGKNYVEFPYDWRQSNFTTASQFATFADRNPVLKGKEFDIIAHSMGGLVVQIYAKTIDQEKRRVRRLINMGVPFFGSVNTIGTLHDGWGTAGNWVAGGLYNIRRFSLSMPSFYELLPQYPLCCILGKPGGDPRDRQPFNILAWDGWRQVNWVPPEDITDASRKAIQAALASANKLRTLAATPYPSHVEVFNIVGSNITTRALFYVDPAAKAVIRTNYDKGDGTVPEGSAANGNLSGAFVSMAQHQTIFEDDAARETIGRILSGRSGLPTFYNAAVRLALTRDGGLVSIDDVSINIDPPVLRPGEEAIAEVRVNGGAGVDQLRISMIAQGPDGTQIPLDPSTTLDDSSNMESRAIYQARFKGPNGVGNVTVTCAIAGLPRLEDYAAVLPKE